ncbi:MAG TPA: 4Fe-4S cluster-binding domain-containing protein [Elusimicrobiota bacterium]|nr:4Fe-4S cluster-binding domain-containing protein [Elusimicrobiota bacterium]
MKTSSRRLKSEEYRNTAALLRLFGGDVRGGRRLTPDRSRRLIAERDRLLADCLAAGARFHEGNKAKIYSGRLSPGCVACARGTWLCLYLEKRCNRRCFFCPKEKTLSGRVPFENMALTRLDVSGDLETFIRELRYADVSFSGGEPFLEFERLLSYVKRARTALGKTGHVWVYTNGDFVTASRLRRLTAAGLDEIRINLSARGYDTAPVRLAKRHIRRVTVEIPAVPERLDRVRALLPELAALGVDHLNLHELKVTPYNEQRLARGGYSFARGQKACSVVESELTALRLLKESLEKKIRLSVNFCSQCYRERFQQRAYQRVLAEWFVRKAPHRGFSVVRETGLLRRVYFENGAERARSPKSGGVLRREGEKCYVRPESLDAPALKARTVFLEYSVCRPTDDPRESAATLEVSGRTFFHVKRVGLRSVPLRRWEERRLFKKMFLGSRSPGEILNGSSFGGKNERRRAALARAMEKMRSAFDGLETLPRGLPVKYA